MYYDFTIAATQAFGNNMVLSGGKWCIYVKLLVFDLLSHEVAGLVDEQQTAGTYQVSFDASGLSSRVYFIEFRQRVLQMKN
ncbi:MAG: hypothetical protein IPG99_15350 [Ignavibacteria bacterium]|nr:hypothetical protein [Ignavibacteria bacterium]